MFCACVFFFFKQKTAYEMRISDWSSDVCSSDLFPHDAKAYAFTGDALKKAWPKLHAGDCEPFPDDKRAAALLKAAGKAAPKLDAAEIGRAACRESGCQYV